MKNQRRKEMHIRHLGVTDDGKAIEISFEEPEVLLIQGNPLKDGDCVVINGLEFRLDRSFGDHLDKPDTKDETVVEINEMWLRRTPEPQYLNNDILISEYERDTSACEIFALNGQPMYKKEA